MKTSDDAPMLDRVAETIFRYNMVPPHRRVGVAVSGGADSVFLLHALIQLGHAVTAVHLNHRLRGQESDADADFVEDLANAWGVPSVIAETDITKLDANVEQAGRIARYRFFDHVMRSDRVDLVATGHTRSDQAETVLYRFVRGSGTAGLSGILPVTEDGIIRPLIESSREEIRQYLRDNSISWREDSSNSSNVYIRNWLRRDVLPLLAEMNPAVEECLAGTANMARDEEAYWQSETERHSSMLQPDGSAVLVSTADLLNVPKALARRLIRRAIERVKGDLRGIDLRHVDSVIRMLSEAEGHRRVQVPGLDIFRSFEWVRFARPLVGSRFDRDYEFIIDPPATVTLPGQMKAISLEFKGLQSHSRNTHPEWRYNMMSSEIDADRIQVPLEIRNWRPGDAYSRSGGVEKIKMMFQRERIPIWERHGWPVLTSAGRIVWARQFGPAADCMPGPETHRVLCVTEV